MFLSTVKSFFEPSQRTQHLETKLLNLEFLAANYHESLDLGPLFKEVSGEISIQMQERQQSESRREELLLRLAGAAQRAVRHQRLFLEGIGDKFDVELNCGEMKNRACTFESEEGHLEVDGIRRTFKIFVEHFDAESKTILGRVEVTKDSPHSEQAAETSGRPRFFPFSVGLFDFPLFENFRLDHDQRFAVILNRFQSAKADATVVCFSSSLKDRLSFLDAWRNVMESKRLLTLPK